jgi:hypothetical protein
VGRKAKAIIDGQQECCICKEWKPLDDFYPSKVTVSGRETRCNKCTLARQRKYYNDNTELALKKLCEFHKSAGKISGRKKRRELAESSLVTPALLFQMWNSQGGRCAVTGVPMTHIYGKGSILTNVSIDRIDSSLGYIPDNIRLVCKAVNWMKNSMSDRELLQWSALVLNGLSRNS